MPTPRNLLGGVALIASLLRSFRRGGLAAKAGGRHLQALLGTAAVATCLVALLAPGASASFPGHNGQIAFIRTSYGSGASSLWVANADGSSAKQVLSDADAAGWSADGTKLVYYSGSFGKLSVSAADGTGAQVITTAPSGDYFYGAPSFSPDGSTILYTQQFSVGTTTEYQIMEVSATAGASPKALTAGPNDQSPRFSPDGSKIVFSHGATATSPGHIYVMNADGSSPVDLTGSHSGINDNQPDFSPDGKTIVFQRQSFGAGGTTFHIFTMKSSDGSAQTDLTPSAGSQTDYEQSSFSPDGAQIVYDNTSSLRVMNSDGSGDRVLGESNPNAQTPSNRSGDADTLPVWQPQSSASGGSTGSTGSTGGGGSTSMAAPVNTAKPTVDGPEPWVGNTFDGSSGSWDGKYSYTYTWLRCPEDVSVVSQCTTIVSGANHLYNLAAADEGKRIYLQVTATNTANGTQTTVGEDSFSSVIGPPHEAPENFIPPEIISVSPASVGVTLESSPGNWKGTAPFTYVYAWYRCASGDNNPNDCQLITSPFGGPKSYKLVSADTGKKILLKVAACNDAGCASAYAAHFTGVILGVGDPQFSPTAKFAYLPDVVHLGLNDARKSLAKNLTYVDIDYRFRTAGCSEQQTGEVVAQEPGSGRPQVSAESPQKVMLTVCLFDSPEVRACATGALRDDLRAIEVRDGDAPDLVAAFLKQSVRCQTQYDVKIAPEPPSAQARDTSETVLPGRKRDEIRSAVDCPENPAEQDLRLAFSEGAAQSSVLSSQVGVGSFSFRRNGPEGWTLPAGWLSYFKLTVNDRAARPVAADVYVDGSDVGALDFRQGLETMDDAGSRVYSVVPSRPGTIRICAVAEQGGRALWGTSEIKVVDLPPGEVWETITGRRIVIPLSTDRMDGHDLGANPVNADLVPKYARQASAAASLGDIWNWIVSLFNGSSRSVNKAAASGDASKVQLRDVYGKSAVSPLQINTCGDTLSSNPSPPVIGDGTVFGQATGTKVIDVLPVVAAKGRHGCGAALMATEPIDAAQASQIKNVNGGTISKIVATGGGNIVAQGGGNIVAQGGGNVVGHNGSAIVSTNGSNIVGHNGSAIVAQGGGNIVSTNGSNVLAAGGGNGIAPAGAQIVATGGGNLISQDGSGIVATGGGNLISQDGSGIVATGRRNALP